MRYPNPKIPQFRLCSTRGELSSVRTNGPGGDGDGGLCGVQLQAFWIAGGVFAL
jgi:hypothetical protein